ncbi:MAG: ABC transporter permease [Actinomycetota bacterium]|nr:ABC transporter permease [Actinomycetota bacterium]MDQ3574756.1 ABC transporter permease [Actinomycetota bacterium]
MSGADRMRLVAAREIRERVRARSFQITTVLMAVGVAAVIIVPNLADEGPDTVRVGEIGTPTPARREALLAAGRLAGVQVALVSVPDPGAAERGLRAEELDLALLARTETEGPELLVNKRPEPESGLGRLVDAVSQALGVQSGLERAGLTPEAAAAALDAPPLPLRSLEPPRPDRQRQAGALSFIVAIVLYLMLLQYGAWTLYGVVEEKSSRVVEVILAAVRPTQLLVGKVLGIGVVALGQGLVLAGTALVTGMAVGLDRLPEGTPVTIAVTLMWFMLGFSLYSFAFATVGSLASRQEDAQNASFPLTAIMTLGYFVGVGEASSPDALLARVLSFLPPTAPFVMPARAASGVAPWEVPLAVALSVSGIVLTARLAGFVYTRAVLRGGARLKLRQAWRAQPA